MIETSKGTLPFFENTCVCHHKKGEDYWNKSDILYQFVLYRCTLSILMNEYHLFLSKKILKKKN